MKRDFFVFEVRFTVTSRVMEEDSGEVSRLFCWKLRVLDGGLLMRGTGKPDVGIPALTRVAF